VDFREDLSHHRINLYDFNFYLSDKHIGSLSYSVIDKVILFYFQPLKYVSFLKRNGLEENSKKKENNLHLGLLTLTEASKILQNKYSTKPISYSKPISPVAKKFFKGIGVDVEKNYSFGDFANILIQESIKRGFEF
jgi:hypothetical protein